MCIIREVEIDDIEEVTSLWVKWCNLMGIQDEDVKFSTKAPQMYRDYILSNFGRQDYFHFVAVSKNDGIVGFIEGFVKSSHPMFHREKYGFIYNTYVRKSFREKNIGRKLFQAAEERLKSLGITRIELAIRSKNTAGIKFFKKIGFTDHALMLEKFIEK